MSPFDPAGLKEKLTSIEEEMNKPGFWDDPESAQKYMKEKKSYPFIGQPMRRVLMTGSREDLDATFEMAVKSVIAYSKEQREFIMEYVKENPGKINALIDNAATKNRENAVACAMMVEELSENSLHTAKFMKQPADLLRYAAFKSLQRIGAARDPYGAIALKDVTVTVWQDTESAFYKNLMPDEIKPEEDQTGKVSVATFSSYFPDGTYPAYFIAKGCNMVYLKGDISKYTVGKSWQASATTHNVGNGGVSFNWVSGMDVYHNGFGAGQIFNIHGCSDSIFNNIGGKGADGLNWLFGGCVSDVSNNFDGDPVVTDFYDKIRENAQ